MGRSLTLLTLVLVGGFWALTSTSFAEEWYERIESSTPNNPTFHVQNVTQNINSSDAVVSAFDTNQQNDMIVQSPQPLLVGLASQGSPLGNIQISGTAGSAPPTISGNNPISGIAGAPPPTIFGNHPVQAIAAPPPAPISGNNHVSDKACAAPTAK
jgi:hypothetical protein